MGFPMVPRLCGISGLPFLALVPPSAMAQEGGLVFAEVLLLRSF
jgi:hypothetical protein